MSTDLMGLQAYGHVISALAYLVFSGHVLRSGRFGHEEGRKPWVFIAALWASAGWAGASAMDSHSKPHGLAHPGLGL